MFSAALSLWNLLIVTFENARLSSFSGSSVSPASIETMSNTSVSTSSHELIALKPSLVSVTLIFTLIVSPAIALYFPASILRADSPFAISVFDSGCSDVFTVPVGTAVGTAVGSVLAEGSPTLTTAPRYVGLITEATLSPSFVTMRLAIAPPSPFASNGSA